VGDKYQQGIYDGRKLVDKQNVVLVNINYRPHPWLQVLMFHGFNMG